MSPTVGRILHYFSNPGALPKAAIVVHVWSETMVNLTVFDQDGQPMPKTGVQLLSSAPVAGPFCAWPPRA